MEERWVAYTVVFDTRDAEQEIRAGRTHVRVTQIGIIENLRTLGAAIEKSSTLKVFQLNLFTSRNFADSAESLLPAFARSRSLEYVTCEHYGTAKMTDLRARLQSNRKMTAFQAGILGKGALSKFLARDGDCAIGCRVMHFVGPRWVHRC
jgi:hypothetical protein